MNETNKELYNARLKRITDAISLTVPDRVPVTPSHMMYYMTKVQGISNKEAMLDHDKRLNAWKTVTQQLNFDMAVHPVVLPPAQPFIGLNMQQYKWPGQDLPEDAPFQYVEDEYLKADEYDDFFQNPGDFTVRVLWPRIAESMSPLSKLPPLHWFSNGRSLAYGLAPNFGMQPFITFFQKMAQVGQDSLQFAMKMLQHIEEMKQLGFPLGCGAGADAPYDYLADQLRGMKGSMLDMYRRPEKVLKATDMFTEMMIETAKMHAAISGNKRVWMPLHRGSAAFMSDEQFKKFYWPSLKKVMLALIDEGMTPVTFFEGDWTPRLKYLAEMPKGKLMAHFDQVDRKKAKEMIGDVMCFWGNIPGRLLITGTPGQVADDVKELIDMFADNGGLIIDSSMGLPDEAKQENVEAMVETTFSYGTN